MTHLMQHAISVDGDLDVEIDTPEDELLDEIACEVDAGLHAIKDRIVEMYASKVPNLRVTIK